MALSTNPSGNNDGGGGGEKANNGAAAAAAAQGLKHNPGLAMEWTKMEQAILEAGLKYASELNIICYAKIAMELPGKTVRDVALRCMWMSEKESGKRKSDGHNLTRKNRDKKERITAPSTIPSAGVSPYEHLDNDDQMPYKVIDGPTGQLLEYNTQAFIQINANLNNYQLLENINLFRQTRDNLLKILNEVKEEDLLRVKEEVPGVKKPMPPLPVKINEELANYILS